jgi:hypothetical protein
VNRICYHRLERDLRNLESSVDLACYPSHFMTQSHVRQHPKTTSHHSTPNYQRRVCSRTLEYLKAMALGLTIVDTTWIQDLNDDNHLVWGDSQLEQRYSNLCQHYHPHIENDEYSAWLRTHTDWWRDANNYGPCWSALQQRLRRQQEIYHEEKNGHHNNLLEGINILVSLLLWDVKTATYNDQNPLLSAYEAELLGSLAGATCHVLQRDEVFRNSTLSNTTTSKPLIVLVPDCCTEDSLCEVLDIFPMLSHDDGNSFHIDFWTEDDNKETNDDSKNAGKKSINSDGIVIITIVKESWLVESISSCAVAPTSIFTLAKISRVQNKVL